MNKMKELKDIKYNKTPDVFTKVEQIYREYEQRKLIKKRTIKELLKSEK